MSDLDFKIRAWLNEISLYCRRHTYDPDKLKRRLAVPTEWSQKPRANFDHVVEGRTLGTKDYERETDIDFETDEKLFDYLGALKAFFFDDGPFPN